MYIVTNKLQTMQLILYRWKDEHKTSYINNLNSVHITQKLNNLKGSVCRCDNVLSLERHVHELSDLILTAAESCKLNHSKKSYVKVLEKCTKNLIGHSRLAFNNHESNIDC